MISGPDQKDDKSEPVERAPSITSQKDKGAPPERKRTSRSSRTSVRVKTLSGLFFLKVALISPQKQYDFVEIGPFKRIHFLRRYAKKPIWRHKQLCGISELAFQTGSENDYSTKWLTIQIQDCVT